MVLRLAAEDFNREVLDSLFGRELIIAAPLVCTGISVKTKSRLECHVHVQLRHPANVSAMPHTRLLNSFLRLTAHYFNSDEATPI